MTLPRVRHIQALLAAVVTLFIASCSRDESAVFMQFAELPPGGWDEGLYCDFPTALSDSALFADTTARYDVILAVRHTDSYPFSDLFLMVSSSPAAPIPAEVRMVLADAAGNRTGRGRYGIYTSTDTIARHIPLPPLLDLSVGQNMHRGTIPGVVNIGLIIQRTKP